MKKYELLYIIDKDVADDKREAAMKMVENEIEVSNGVVSSVDKWGMKKYAYTINFKNEGFYVLVSFEADPASLKNLEHRMKVNDSFVRYMITNVIENKKTEAAKTAKKPERRERNDKFSYQRAPIADVVTAPVVVAAPVVETAPVVEVVTAPVEA